MNIKRTVFPSSHLFAINVLDSEIVYCFGLLHWLLGLLWLVFFFIHFGLGHGGLAVVRFGHG